MSPDIHTLTGAYAAHSLPDREQREFQEHLEDCAACAAEVRELEATTARLGSALVTTPPPGMKARVMAQVDQTRQLPPLEHGESPGPAADPAPLQQPEHPDVRTTGLDVGGGVPAAVDTDDAAGDADDKVEVDEEFDTDEDGSAASPITRLPAEGPRRRRSRASHRLGRRWVQVLTAAAAVVLLVAVALLGATTLSLRNQVEDLQAQRNTVEQILTAEDATVATGEADGRSGRVVIAPSQESGVFFASGLEPAPAGQTYQGWLINSETDIRSAGLFQSSAEGTAVLVLTGDLPAAQAFAVTLEPEGGSAQPTSLPPLLAVPLQV